ncbi:MULTISPECIES: hypothetical protein [unclassified Streptomyces]|uniref:hypothetical protein n=1 Tax=Streptomyces sp. SYP-A7185 TaxID=3040076 RepID=UPI0038F6B597
MRSDPLQVSARTAPTPWCGVVAAEVEYAEPLGGVLLVPHTHSWPYGFEAEREAQARAVAALAEEILAEGRGGAASAREPAQCVRAGDMPPAPGRRVDHVMARCGPHGPTCGWPRASCSSTSPSPACR